MSTLIFRSYRREQNQTGFNRDLLIGLNENALQGCISYARLSRSQSEVRVLLWVSLLSCSLCSSSLRRASAIGHIMAVVAILLSHMERNQAGNIMPNINLKLTGTSSYMQQQILWKVTICFENG